MNFAAQKPAPAPAAQAVAPAPAPAVPAAAPASDEIAMNEAARTEAPRAHAMGAAVPRAIAGNAAISAMDLAAQKPASAPRKRRADAPAAPAAPAPVNGFAMNSTREAPRALAGSAGAPGFRDGDGRAGRCGEVRGTILRRFCERRGMRRGDFGRGCGRSEQVCCGRIACDDRGAGRICCVDRWQERNGPAARREWRQSGFSRAESLQI